MHAAVQAELNLLNEGLQRRQQAAAAKALLELMQDTAHAMAKVRECCTIWECCANKNCFRVRRRSVASRGPCCCQSQASC